MTSRWTCALRPFGNLHKRQIDRFIERHAEKQVLQLTRRGSGVIEIKAESRRVPLQVDQLPGLVELEQQRLRPFKEEARDVTFDIG